MPEIKIIFSRCKVHLLKISKEEWAQVKAYFTATPTAIKLSKKKSNLRYSFIKIKDKIVAIGYFLGEGTFGIVKVAQDAEGKNYAIKTEGGPISSADIEENDILTALGLSYGITTRKLDAPKVFIPDHETMRFESDIKKYKLHVLFEGTDLIFELYDKYAYNNLDELVPRNTLTHTQKLIIAIKCCQLLKELQRLRIIHADLKPENIKVRIEGNNITVYFMDFGFSMRLKSGNLFRIDVIKGSGQYMAPEIYNPDEPTKSQGRFSFESDIYAMGIMFKENLELDKHLYEGMIKTNPTDRDKIDLIINNLITELQKVSDLDEVAKAFIGSVKPSIPLTTTAARAAPLGAKAPTLPQAPKTTLAKAAARIPLAARFEPQSTPVDQGAMSPQIQKLPAAKAHAHAHAQAQARPLPRPPVVAVAQAQKEDKAPMMPHVREPMAAKATEPANAELTVDTQKLKPAVVRRPVVFAFEAQIEQAKQTPPGKKIHGAVATPLVLALKSK